LLGRREPYSTGVGPRRFEGRTVNFRPNTKARRTGLLALVAGTVIAAILAAAVPTYSLNTHRTGARDDRGFPTHYTDARGMMLQLCEDGTRRCLGADPGDLVAPEGEALYWSAFTTLRSRRGPIDVEFALEAAFAGQRPIVFNRIRIRGHLNHRGRYILEHPYGRTRFHAMTPREDRNVNLTRDRFCSVERNGRCKGGLHNFLRAKNPPKGYAGFGGRRTLVKGGTFRNNMVLKTRHGKVIGHANKFVVVGQKAG
jgi:hypothetical protein